MKFFKQKKATIGWSALISVILGLVVIGAVVIGVVGPGVGFAKKKFFNENQNKWIFPWMEQEFEPYVPEEYFDMDEIKVGDSMKALQLAINSLVRGESVNVHQKNTISPNKIDIEYYTVSFSGHIKLEEGGLGLNDYREWNFIKRFDINHNAEKIQLQKDQYVFADYKYGSCSDNNEGWWVECDTPFLGEKQEGSLEKSECYCNDEDDYNFGEMPNLKINKNTLKKAKKEGLAPIRDIKLIYNIELTVHYKDGRECKVGTWDSDEKITNLASKDLLVWGATSVKTCPNNPYFKKGDGCDRDGDGIQGAYGQRFYDIDWDKVINQTNTKESVQAKKSLISKLDKKVYFPNGQIQKISNNGEGCLDSPTWLECEGIRIYYCGKLGLKSTSGGEESNYYFHVDGTDNKVHSNAGIKILRDINKAYEHEQSSQNRNDGKKNIKVRDQDAISLGAWTEGAWNYAKEHDLDVVIMPVTFILGQSSLHMRKLDNPSLYCYGEQRINNGDVAVKCDKATQSCGVCNFELPQDIEKDYDTTLAWFAGYGDPKYVVYYEAFPYGEHESWQVEPLSLGLQSAVIINMGLSVGIPIGGAAIRQGGKLLKTTGKMLKLVTIPGIMVKAIKTGYKGIKGSADLAANTKNFVKAMFKGGKAGTKIMLAETGEAALGKGVKIVSKMSEKELSKVATKLGVAEATNQLVGKTLRLELMELAEQGGIKKILKEAATNPQFTKGIGKTLLRKGPSYTTGYLLALAMAREDSINQKFLPIGVNNIGIKEPYGAAFVKELDPKANKYIVMLRKDKYRGGKLTNVVLDQTDTRFYLASPCKANLALVKANKECWSLKGKNKIVDEHGKEKEVIIAPEIPEGRDDDGNIIEGSALDVYGHVPFLSYTVDDEKYPDKTDPKRYENAVKECVDKSAGLEGLWATITWDSPKYNTEAIIVNPIPSGNTWDEGVNFCYGGSHTLADFSKIGVLGGTIAASVGTEILFTTAEGITSPTIVLPFVLEAVNGLVNAAIDVAGAWLINTVTKTTKWPNH